VRPGKKSAIDNDSFAGTESGFARSRKSETRLPGSPGTMNHSALVECGDCAGGSLTDLNSVARVTTVDRRRPTVMCGGREFTGQSRWPARLAVLLRRKLRVKQASLATGETLRGASFSDRLRSYLKPERVRGNKEQQLGGRLVAFRQQASSFGHSRGNIERCSQA
jgi:hypothetical protein